MAFDPTSVNFLAIVISAVASFIFGFLWYGPFFGKAWAKEMKFSKKDMDAGKKSMVKFMIINFIGILITAFVLANILTFTAVTSIAQGLQLVVWIWLGFFVAATLLNQSTWGGKSAVVYLLDGAYWLINLIIIVAILLAF